MSALKPGSAEEAGLSRSALYRAAREGRLERIAILERGITSTRWRDYVDIVQLARQGIDTDEP